MEEEFNKIVNIVNNNKKNKELGITTNNMVDFYKFYKQSKNGDCNIPEPSFIYLEEKTKWSAWNSIKGMSKEDAMKKYCEVYYSIV
jgi:diazepam-binding inhibitor (GABA receptor modulating acyl-CoA-binding protein)